MDKVDRHKWSKTENCWQLWKAITVLDAAEMSNYIKKTAKPQCWVVRNLWVNVYPERPELNRAWSKTTIINTKNTRSRACPHDSTNWGVWRWSSHISSCCKDRMKIPYVMNTTSSFSSSQCSLSYPFQRFCLFAHLSIQKYFPIINCPSGPSSLHATVAQLPVLRRDTMRTRIVLVFLVIFFGASAASFGPSQPQQIHLSLTGFPILSS